MIVYSKHHLSQLHDKGPKGMSLACKTFLESYLTTLEMSFTIFLKPMPEVRVKVTQKCLRHSSTPKCIPPPNLNFFTTNYIQICSGLDLYRTEARSQCRRNPETVGDSRRPKMYPHATCRQADGMAGGQVGIFAARAHSPRNTGQAI